MAATIRHFRELDVYQLAMQAAMEIFEVTIGKLVNMISHSEQWTIRSIREDEAGYA